MNAHQPIDTGLPLEGSVLPLVTSDDFGYASLDEVPLPTIQPRDSKVQAAETFRGVCQEVFRLSQEAQSSGNADASWIFVHDSERQQSLEASFSRYTTFFQELTPWEKGCAYLNLAHCRFNLGDLDRAADAYEIAGRYLKDTDSTRHDNCKDWLITTIGIKLQHLISQHQELRSDEALLQGRSKHESLIELVNCQNEIRRWGTKLDGLKDYALQHAGIDIPSSYTIDEEAFPVLQNEFVYVKTQKVGTVNLNECVFLVVKNPTTGWTMAFHVSASTSVDTLIDAIDKILWLQGTVGRLEIKMRGGRPSTQSNETDVKEAGEPPFTAPPAGTNTDPSAFLEQDPSTLETEALRRVHRALTHFRHRPFVWSLVKETGLDREYFSAEVYDPMEDKWHDGSRPGINRLHYPAAFSLSDRDTFDTEGNSHAWCPFNEKLSDHDSSGMLPLRVTPALWEEIQQEIKELPRIPGLSLVAAFFVQSPYHRKQHLVNALGREELIALCTQKQTEIKTIIEESLAETATELFSGKSSLPETTLAHIRQAVLDEQGKYPLTVGSGSEAATTTLKSGLRENVKKILSALADIGEVNRSIDYSLGGGHLVE